MTSDALTAAPRSAVATAAALTTRYLDFWLLGGASLLVWAIASAAQPLRSHSWALDHHFANLAAISATVSLLVNYPHFMASYKLAYAQGARFVLRFWLQLIAVPVLLLALMTLSYLFYGDPQSGRAFVIWLNQTVHAHGFSGIGPGNFGKELLGLLVNLMYFSVGWHYSKQAFGCMMVQARYDGYALSALQRRVLKVSLFSIWASAYTWSNLGFGVREFMGVPYYQLGFPAPVHHACLAFFAASVVAVIWLVLIENLRGNGQRPSASFLVPYAAFVAWWIPALTQREFFLYAVPFFHSLQYLGFVYRVEKTRLDRQHPGEQAARGTIIALGLVLAGFLCFELGPSAVDVYSGTKSAFGAWFFMICAHVFINVHHYFIDNVIWRSGNRAVTSYLS